MGTPTNRVPEEIRETTIKNALARKIICERYPVLLPPDQMLTELDDASYKLQVNKQMAVLLEDFEEMKQTRASHGTNAEGKRVSMVDHTREVVCGEFGGLGLKTDGLPLNLLPLKSARRILRVAALYHYTGKLSSRKEDYRLFSKRKAEAALAKKKALTGLSHQEIAVVCALIENHSLLGSFLRGKIDEEALSRRVTNSYKEVKNSISELDYRKLLLALYTAHASTLKKAHPHLKNFNSSDFLILRWNTL